jgi:outer membrane receptor protein involved in Fe transport
MKRSTALALSSMAIAVKLALVPVHAQTPATGAVVQAQPRGAAQVWVYAYRAGQPASGVEAKLGARVLGVTSAQGVVGGAVTTGPQTLTVRDGQREVAIELDLAAGEQVQIALQFVPGRAPAYTLKSSVKGTTTVDLAAQEAAAAAAAAAPVTAGGDAAATGSAQPGTAGAGNTATLDAINVEGEAVRVDDRAAYVDLKRMSVSVDDTLSIEQITRAGDTDAAVALRRVTGLTLVNSRFIYVRGLGERYSSVLLNGASIPSPDPTRRVIPLDLFPTDVLEGVVVQKTYTPDMPGEFGGGTIQLRTKTIPLQPFFRASVTVGGEQGTTFKDGLRYDGGSDDWTGRDRSARNPDPTLDGVRSAGGFFAGQSFGNPGGFSPAEIERVGESVAANGRYDTFQDRIGPDFGAAVSAGQRFDLSDDVRFGVLGSVRYAQSWDSQQEVRRNLQATSGGLIIRDETDLDGTTREIDLSAFSVLGLELGAEHRFSLTSMLLRQTEDEAREQTGIIESQQLQRYKLEWIENSLRSHQLAGQHRLPWFGEMADFDWQYTDATARRYAPNLREYRFDIDDGGARALSNNSGESNTQTWSDLTDDSRSLDLGFKAPFAFNDGAAYGTVDLNTGRTLRDRDSYIRRYGFSPRFTNSMLFNEVRRLPSLGQILVPQYIGPNGFVLQETTSATDNYFADQRLEYVGLGVDVTLNDRFRLNAGARYEDNQQRVTTFSVLQAGQIIQAGLDESDVLPSFGATWMIDDTQQLRFGWSRTLSRPDFRELTPAPFLDPVLDILSFGNPDLVSASITNLDLRWEYYFSADESLSVALFRKEFDKPIEKQLLPGSGNLLLTLANADSATNQGVEIDYFQRLAWADGWFGDVDMSNWFVAANYAWIDSEIRLDASRSGINTNLNRPLEGQSPYVVNLQVGYSSPDGTHETALSYNVAGERIVQVGIDTQPDVYEQPAGQLDFNWKWQFAQDWSTRVRLRNLLDPSVEFEQGNINIREFKRGREIALTLEWSPKRD